MTLGLGTIRRPRATDLAVIKRIERVSGLLGHISLTDETVPNAGCGYGLQALEARL